MEVMNTLSSLFIFIAVVSGAFLIWLLCKSYYEANRSTKRAIHICFWVLFGLVILYFSPYLDFEKAFRRGMMGGVSALIIISLYWLIVLLINKFGKNGKSNR